MKRQRAFKLAAAGGAAFALQGCIAAAFPIAASGLLATGARTSGTDEAETAIAEPVQTSAVAPETEAEPVGYAAGNLTAQTEVATGSQAVAGAAETGDARDARAGAITSVEPETAPLASSSISDNPPSAVTPITAAAPPVSAAAPIAAAVPPPAPPPPPSPSATSASQPATAPTAPTPSTSAAPVTLFDPLFGYASSPEFVGGQDRTSAMLRDATSLEADRVKCDGGTPTVLIDLDPREGELFPVDAGTASPALAERLTQLRSEGVSIAWISDSPADRESIIRVALFRSGLDQLGADRLLLVRAPDQRKQLLREQLAETSCLVAIAGDERADFHELFDYLLNPSDAVALEPMIGEGWFLIPTPLLAEGTR